MVGQDWGPEQSQGPVHSAAVFPQTVPVFVPPWSSQSFGLIVELCYIRQQQVGDTSPFSSVWASSCCGWCRYGRFHSLLPILTGQFHPQHPQNTHTHTKSAPVGYISSSSSRLTASNFSFSPTPAPTGLGWRRRLVSNGSISAALTFFNSCVTVDTLNLQMIIYRRACVNHLKYFEVLISFDLIQRERSSNSGQHSCTCSFINIQ